MVYKEKMDEELMTKLQVHLEQVEYLLWSIQRDLADAEYIKAYTGTAIAVSLMAEIRELMTQKTKGNPPKNDK